MWKSERTNCSAASPSSFCFRSYLTAQTNTESAGSAASGWPSPAAQGRHSLSRSHSCSQASRAGSSLAAALHGVSEGLRSPVPHRGCAPPSGTTANAAWHGAASQASLSNDGWGSLVPAEMDNLRGLGGVPLHFAQSCLATGKRHGIAVPMPCVGMQGQGGRTGPEMLQPACTKKESADPPSLGASVQPTALEMGAGCWRSQPGEDPCGSAMRGDRDEPPCQTSCGTKKLPAGGVQEVTANGAERGKPCLELGSSGEPRAGSHGWPLSPGRWQKGETVGCNQL